PFPQPASEVLQVNPPEDALYLEVVDASGRIVFRGAVPHALDVRNWQNGLYVARMQTKRGTFAQKWHIQR
ncbi:MAG: T9SS C-terminal target domain-containing protein, partial [Flavobacteriia bacterium]|nr:T9SS C-terminal target domain-containing protein [Flavobacteriia bacterium]